jgi:hypothetical protein
LREKGLKVGFYFSHIDWNHPDYATVGNDDDPDGAARGWNEYAHAPKGEEEPLRWERFREQYHAQVYDLIDRYQPDLLWFDGEWERSDEQWGADRRTIYLVCVEDPRGHLAVRGLKNVVRRVRVVGSGTELAFRKADAPDEVPTTCGSRPPTRRISTRRRP